jgi:hypothetical protein
MEDSMTDITTAIDRYFAVWNETDPTRRRDLIANTWSDDATYLDPLLAAEGQEGIDAMVAAVHDQFPGHRFRQTGEADSHNDRVRFTWELVGPGATSPLIAGTDFGIIAADGRLQSVTGFLDLMPAMPESPDAVETGVNVS